MRSVRWIDKGGKGERAFGCVERDVDDDLAAGWVNRGIAEYADEKPKTKALHAPPEHAAVKAPPSDGAVRGGYTTASLKGPKKHGK